MTRDAKTGNISCTHPSGTTDREDAHREDSCKWTTVVRSGMKRRAMAATPPTPSMATADSKGLVIGSASVSCSEEEETGEYHRHPVLPRPVSR